VFDGISVIDYCPFGVGHMRGSFGKEKIACGFRTFSVWFIVFAMVFSAIPVFSNYMDSRDSCILMRLDTGTISKSSLASLNLEIVAEYDDYVIASMTECQIDLLGKAGLSLKELPDNDKIIFFEQGIEFSTDFVPEFSADLTTSENQYIVQFVGPAKTEWLAQIEELGAVPLMSVPNNAEIVEMDIQSKGTIQELAHVRWIGEYLPAYKLQKGLLEKEDTINIEIHTFGTGQEIISQLSDIGPVNYHVPEFGKIEMTIRASDIPRIARLPEVKAIMDDPELITYNNVRGEIEMFHVPWDITRSNLPVQLCGEGQTFGVLDTGLDGSHWDFTQGPLGNRIVYAETTNDPDLHGTMLTGVAAGNGYCMEQWLGLDNMNRVYYELAASNPLGHRDLAGFAGSAPEAYIVSATGLGQVGDWGTLLANSADVISNSWGPSTVTNGYSGDCDDADTFMLTNPDCLITFGVGNFGPTEHTSGGGGHNKNGLGVGGTENNRPDLTSDTDDPKTMYFSGGKGPTAIGRIKPDIVAVSSGVYSCKDDAGTPDEYYDGYRDGLIDVQQAGQADYMYWEGTSLSSAAVAGDSLIVREYLQEFRDISNPSATLVKTLMLNGAEDIGYGYPSYAQGWGRVNVENVVCPPAPRNNQFAEGNIGTGSTWDAAIDGGLNLEVKSDEVPLKITLSYMDSAGSEVLDDDYDLRVMSPGGIWYQGNAFNDSWSIAVPSKSSNDWSACHYPYPNEATGYDYDTGDDGGDDLNNVENVFIESPEPGIWTIEVYGADAEDNRGFCVAASADFGPDAEYEVEIISTQHETLRMAPSSSAMFEMDILNYGLNSDIIQITNDALLSFSFSYVPATSYALDSGQRERVIAVIETAGASTGTYNIRFTATSQNDVSLPIAQDYVDVQVFIVDDILPSTAKITDSQMADKDPSVVAFNDGTIDWVIVGYLKDVGNDCLVYAKVSSDGGQSFGEPIQISTKYDSPADVRLSVMDGGTYAWRVFVSWHSIEPFVYDLTYSRGYIAYADLASSYTSWSTPILINDDTGGGWGPNAANIQRATGTICLPARDEVIYYWEAQSYDNSDYQIAVLTGVNTLARISSNGGVTWNAATIVSPADGDLYFFPNGHRDEAGNAVIWYYWWDLIDQERDLCFSYYDGAWSGRINAWDTADNVMFPAGTSTTEGVNNNRNYFVCARGVGSETPKEIYGGYTDDMGGSFTTNIGPLSGIIDDSNYVNCPVLDADSDTGDIVWVTYREDTMNSIYKIQNIMSIEGWAGLSSFNNWRITSDPYTKGHQATDTSGTDVYTVWHSYGPDDNMDIYLTKYEGGWSSNPDLTGPEVTYGSSAPYFVGAGTPLNILAGLDDINAGGSDISYAEYSLETAAAPGTGIAMNAYDGAFDSPVEVAEAVIDTTG